MAKSFASFGICGLPILIMACQALRCVVLIPYFMLRLGYQHRCSLQKECGVYTLIEHKGDVYSCDFFVDPKRKLGNIKDKEIINMLNLKKQHQFGCVIANLLRKCKTCSHLRYCLGGCAKD